MPSSTVKARERAISHTLEAAERMAAIDIPGNTDSPAAPPSEKPAPVRCPECGTVNRKRCCWYSRSVWRMEN
ncbi:MAG: hypothetical protein V4671_21070 [Armatimonadota bacterium]